MTRDDEKWTVEVKGTTSLGEAVPLTRGEVEHHAKAYPNNALAAVRSIVLDKSTSPPTVSGGVFFEQQPWGIQDSALKVIAYQYAVPSDLYDAEQVFPDEYLIQRASTPQAFYRHRQFFVGRIVQTSANDLFNCS